MKTPSGLKSFGAVLVTVLLASGTDPGAQRGGPPDQPAVTVRGQTYTPRSILSRNMGTEEDQTTAFPPHKVIGNIYYVGTRTLSAFLITTPAGHILLNSTYERNVRTIEKSVTQLGFKFADIRILLGTHAHGDHQEGDALVKELTGAQVLAMREDVPALEAIKPGGKTHPVDRTISDGDRVTLGGATLVAHLTAGHTPGSTTWTMSAQEDGKAFNVVFASSYRAPATVTPEVEAAFNRTFKRLRSLPCDVPLGDHPAQYNLAAKYARLKQGAPNPFVDAANCWTEAEIQEAMLRAQIALQQKGASGATPQSPPTHELRLVPQNVHWGYYDATVKPVLRMASGDTLRVETMVARGLQRLRAAGVPDADIPDSLKAVERSVTERGPGAHPLTGPIWIEGAEPGDLLEVKILGFEFLHPYGVSGFIPNNGTLPEDFPYTRFKLVRFNLAAGTAEFAPGVTLRLAPFFGSIGVAPDPLVGRISSGPPGHHTGNLDNKELVAGSTLFLPVHVPGALLSLGDGHALQGDGEVTLTALETSLRGTVQVTLRKGRRLTWPRAETPTHYIAMGLHTDLDEAARLATREMIDFLVAEKGMDRGDAYILCSLAADLRVTQLVDGTKGIHAMVAKSVFTR